MHKIAIHQNSDHQNSDFDEDCRYFDDRYFDAVEILCIAALTIAGFVIAVFNVHQKIRPTFNANPRYVSPLRNFYGHVPGDCETRVLAPTQGRMLFMDLELVNVYMIAIIIIITTIIFITIFSSCYCSMIYIAPWPSRKRCMLPLSAVQKFKHQ